MPLRFTGRSIVTTSSSLSSQDYLKAWMALRQKEDAERLIPKYVHANFEAGSDGIYFLSGNGGVMWVYIRQ